MKGKVETFMSGGMDATTDDRASSITDAGEVLVRTLKLLEPLSQAQRGRVIRSLETYFETTPNPVRCVDG